MPFVFNSFPSLTPNRYGIDDCGAVSRTDAAPRGALHATTTVVTISNAENTVCPTGIRKLLSTKHTALTAYTQPVQRGKRLLAVIAIPVRVPPR